VRVGRNRRRAVIELSQSVRANSRSVFGYAYAPRLTCRHDLDHVPTGIPPRRGEMDALASPPPPPPPLSCVTAIIAVVRSTSDRGRHCRMSPSCEESFEGGSSGPYDLATAGQSLFDRLVARVGRIERFEGRIELGSRHLTGRLNHKNPDLREP